MYPAFLWGHDQMNLILPSTRALARIVEKGELSTAACFPLGRAHHNGSRNSGDLQGKCT